jgi:hypothetical protein
VPEKAELAPHGGAGKESIGAAVGEHGGGPTGGGNHPLGAGGDTGGRAQGGSDSPSSDLQTQPADPALPDPLAPLSADRFQVGVYHPDAPAAAAELHNAFLNGEPTEALAGDLADYSTHHSPGDPSIADRPIATDRVVLGKWDGLHGGYIGEAEKNGGIYFDTGGETWAAMTNGLSPAQRREIGWSVNERFLLTQLESGVAEIEYVLPKGFDSVEQVANVDRESFSAFEIEFLQENAANFGYRQFGNRWIREDGTGDELG